MFSSFTWMNVVTSPIGIVLVACSVITFGAALERFYYFAKRRGNPDDVFRKALLRVREGKLREVELICENTRHPVGAVSLDVLRAGETTAETFEEKLQVSLSVQRLLFERNLGWLATMAAAGPLLGLLGTVWGIMHAFSDMALTGSAAPSVVAAGVAEALVTTLIGLMIAIPALVAYNHLSRRMNVMLTLAENHARALRMALSEHAAQEEPQASQGRRARSVVRTRTEEVFESEPELSR